MLKVTTSIALGGVLLGAMAYLHPLMLKELDCSGGGRACPRVIEAENGLETLSLYDEVRVAKTGGLVSPETMRANHNQKMALEAKKDQILGANGRWSQYGRGPLRASGLANTLGLGPIPRTFLQEYAGRVDNFAYDPVARRLFVAVGTGGIWMSEAVGGDVRTIGDQWVSVGDKLPTQANGAVIWTAAGGGTLISAGGDSVMSTGAFPGLGAYWSNDLGTTWNRAEGFPDGVMVFNAESDPANASIVYIASSRGLYRSEDAGRSFTNVALPVGVNGGVDCAGNIDATSPCNLASVVSDVVVKHPGGTSKVFCSSRGCPVLAAVGWRNGRIAYPGTDVPHSPNNGLYRSETGEPGTFVRVETAPLNALTEEGFAPAERVGRIEMGVASGPLQDHNYVYAVVQDAELLNGARATLDPPLDALGPSPVGLGFLSGIYVSPDFGSTWRRMANVDELVPASAFSALVPPGVQSWYNAWIQVDPTRVEPVTGTPTRLAFGLEEVWQSRLPHVPLNGTLQAGPADFEVLGRYFSATGADQTTHPDQHAGIYIPITDDLAGTIGVCLFIGNDGGVNRQCVLNGQEMNNPAWGIGHNRGFYTLLPYGMAVAKDGTVWFGLQDNGSGHIEPDTLESIQDFGGDGFYAEVNPDNSNISYTETQNGGLKRTKDRGLTSTSIAPPYTRVNFANWFSMDPLDPNHMITTAQQVYETLDAENVTAGTWNEVYNLGFNPRTDAVFTGQFADVHGSAIYVGACGDCGVTANDGSFQNRIATNVGGKLPPNPGTSDGWHDATAKGLPNRLIMSIEIDPNDPKTVYVGLGGYSSPFRDVDSFAEDSNGAMPDAGNIFKSTDAAETFVSIQGDLPKVPVSSIVVRNGQLLVGTDFGAFISSDLDGSSWSVLGSGLPNVPVSQIKVQPGNPNKLFASTYGRHIWTYEFPPDAQVATAREARFGGALGGGLLLVLLALFGARSRVRG
jgi:hypothetical protein